MATKCLRLLGASGLAATAVVLAAIAHTLSGEQHPSPMVLDLLMLAGMAASAPLLGREVGRTRVVSLLVGSQVTLHLALGPLTMAPRACRRRHWVVTCSVTWPRRARRSLS